MTHTYELESVDLEFFHTAKHRVSHRIMINCSSARMMQALRDNAQWAAWATPIKHAVWTSAIPEKNCTRDVHLFGGVIFREIFFHWSDNKRVAFSVTSANIPGLNKFAEDHSITQISEQKTQLDLTVAFEMKATARALSPVLLLILKVAIPRMLNKYKRLLEMH